MACISLLALSLTATNLVHLSEVGFFLPLLCSRRFFGRSYPPIIKPISSIRLLVMAATEHRLAVARGTIDQRRHVRAATPRLGRPHTVVSDNTG
jgi:hypothetical protein